MATVPKEGEEPETLNFKEANDSNNQSSRGCITCPFYNKLSHVMGDKPSCKPLELLDSYEAGEEEPETLRSSADSVMRLMSFLFFILHMWISSKLETVHTGIGYRPHFKR